MAKNMAKKAFEERRQKRQMEESNIESGETQSTQDAICETQDDAVQQLQQQYKIERATNARKDLLERVTEIGVIVGTCWAFMAYKKLAILEAPLFTLGAWVAKLLGHKGGLIVFTAIKIDNVLFDAMCVHSQHSLLFGFILTATIYVIVWRLIRLALRTISFVLSRA